MRYVHGLLETMLEFDYEYQQPVRPFVLSMTFQVNWPRIYFTKIISTKSNMEMSN